MLKANSAWGMGHEGGGRGKGKKGKGDGVI